MSAGTLKSGKAKPQQAVPSQPPEPSVFPMLGETQAQFFDRAARALQTVYPSVNQRTVEILRIWQQSPNDQDLRDQSQMRFAEPEYQHFGPRCVFLEHTIPASEDGTRPATVYNRNALQHMVNWANYRIRNSGTYAAISEGHTPTSEQMDRGVKMPPVLGYAGPFYIGLLGDIDPIYAIYADEWAYTDTLTDFNKLQRRSPEVWCKEPIEKRTMDPIAALGSETPRLDSGMNPYSRAGDGQIVQYSAMSFPGATNCYVPGAQTHYGANEMSFPPPGGAKPPGHQPPAGNAPTPPAGQPGQQPPAPGGDDMAAMVTEVIKGLMPSILQAVQQKLGGQMPGDGAGDQMPQDPGATPGAGAGEQNPRGMDGGQPGQPGQPMQGAPAMDEDEQRYAAMGPDCHQAYKAGRLKGSPGMNQAPTQNYSRLDPADDIHKTIARQQLELNESRRLNETLQTRLTDLETQMEQERRDTVRYSKLNELAKTYDLVPEEEMKTTLDFSDEQFERHLTSTVTKYARRGGDAEGLFDDRTLDVERYGRGGIAAATAGMSPELVEKYSREAATIAANKNAKAKGSTTHKAEFEAILKQHGHPVV